MTECIKNQMKNHFAHDQIHAKKRLKDLLKTILLDMEAQ